MEIKRIHHHWDKWEDYKAGFYNNLSGKEKEGMIEKVVELFSDYELTEKYMGKVIKDWYFSCEQNLTNNGMNKVAYIGQAACCLYANIPATITMEAWSLVPEDKKSQADMIAERKLKEWEVFHSSVLNQMSCDNKC